MMILFELWSYGGKAKCRYMIKTVKLDSDVMINNISISFVVSMRQENRIRAIIESIILFMIKRVYFKIKIGLK